MKSGQLNMKDIDMDWDFDSAVVIGACFTFAVAAITYFTVSVETAASFAVMLGL